MREENVTENIMGIMPVPQLILRTSVPLMFSLLVNSLYNFVDSVFVSHVNEAALTALTLAAPIQFLIGALGEGIAVGLNAAVSKAMGEKDIKKVGETASAAIGMAVLSWVVIALCGAAFLHPYFVWQSGGNGVIAEYGIAYLRICMIFSVGQMGQWVFDRFLIAAGKSVMFLYTLGCAVVVNIILDPILIFGYFGLPAMGTTGAAIATVIGQMSGAVLGIVLNKKYNREIPIVYTWKIKAARAVEILRVGIPTAIIRGVVSFLGIALNSLLLSFSSTTVAVYGACTRIQNIAMVGLYGINNGIIPIIAYNYGAGKKERMEQALKWAMIYAYAVGLIMLAVVELFPKPILMLFDASETMLQIGIPALRILAFAYTASTAGLVFSSSFQALGQGNYSMYLTFARQVVFLLPFVFLFAKMRNLTMFWASFMLAELLALPVALLLYRAVKKTMEDNIRRIGGEISNT